MTDPIDRFLAEERAAAIAAACGEPLPTGWAALSALEILAAESHNAECLRRWKLGRKKRKKDERA